MPLLFSTLNIQEQYGKDPEMKIRQLKYEFGEVDLECLVSLGYLGSSHKMIR